jgi:mono/diheme cytochrome c family protein
MKLKRCLEPLLLLGAAIISSASVFADEAGHSAEMRGKYLVTIGGCNDCHTAGYAPSGGAVPEELWLLGDSLGYSGPWGTTYPPNLREYFGKLTEDEWVARAKTVQTRPPMAWWVLNALTEEDARAVYRYISSLGAVANEVPGYLPPGQVPPLPYLEWHVPGE